jgi:superfamily II DNA or RNA helicase
MDQLEHEQITKEYIYIKENPDWNYQKKNKYGYVKGENTNLIKRLHDSTEEHSELSKFIQIYSFEKTDDYKLDYKEIDKIFSLIAPDEMKIEDVENFYDIKLPLLKQLREYLVKSETKSSNEFIYERGLSLLTQIMKEEFPLLGLKLVKIYTQEEIKELNNALIKREKVKNNYRQELEWRKKYRGKSLVRQKDLKQQEKHLYKWFEREYQKTIIEYGIEKLTELHKFYLELATGAGKSFIIYKILSKIKPDTIVIFSPRKNINKQNSSNKYLSILNNEYLVYNYSEGKSFDDFKKKCEAENKKMLIVACPQGSNEKVYDIIHNNNLSNIFVWFDEAHHTIENWVTKPDNKYIKFFFENTEKIMNRIFTSASPDKEHVNTHPQIFGELYSPIKVKKLIALKWLCPITPNILEYDILDFDLIKWILNGFDDNNRSFGFSFHSRDNNAFNLFYKHYNLFKNGETDIKPYLLIQDHWAGNNKLKEIDLDYNFRDKEHFEKTNKSLAYVVKQYAMGYDFQDLDYIVITDPKVSSSDIIQCIGRGTRPDKKGLNGTNLEKELILMLPTYVKEEEKNEYKNIIEVLRYLKFDLEMDIEKLLINHIGASTESKESEGLDYKGDKSNKSKLLDLLYTNNILKKVNTKRLIEFCKREKIKTEQDYYKFKEQNHSLNLKNNLYEYPGFYWKNVVDPNDEVYYSSESECIKSKEKLINDYKQNFSEREYEEFLEDINDNGWIELNTYDSKMPPYRDLDKFYP